MDEYIYILDYSELKKNQAIKIGSTKFPHLRLQTYQTGMFYNLNFKYLYKIIKSKINCYEIDDLIQKTFLNNNWKYLYKEGGNEWYEYPKVNNIILEEFFKNNDIVFEKVLLEDIPKDNDYQKYFEELEIKQKKIWKYGFYDENFKLHMKPYNYQLDVLNRLDNFKKIKKGKLLWACGLGKSFMSLFIVNKLGMKKVLICVPTLYLVEQFKESILKIFNYQALTLHQNGDNVDDIILNLRKNKCIVISTYHSSWKLLKYNFDIKIGDEAHHLVSKINPDDKKTFDKFHKIKSKYTLFMTATEKNFENENKTDEFITMSSEKDFGCLIDKKSIKWAIENKKITDYDVICLRNCSNELNNIIEKIKLDVIVKQINNNIINKKELFFAAYSALKMIDEGKSKYVLVYTNKCYSADLIESIINRLIENNIFNNIDSKDIYNKSLTSKKDINLEEEIDKFKKSKFGIIPCVYIFGEGVDIPKLDSIVIAEKMTTEIRIVQSCLRPNRLDPDNTDKKAKIIIPLNYGNIDDKLKIIINHLASEDDIVEQKIKVFKIVDKNTKKSNSEYNCKIKMKLNKSKLNNIILDLYHSNAFGRKLDIKREFEIVKEMVRLKKFKSVKEYLESDFIKNPNIYFTGVWTDWFDYLGIDTSGWIQTLIEWKKYCLEKNINSSSEYYLNLDEKLPPEPGYFYPNFKGIYNELARRKRRFIKNQNYLFI